MFSPSRLKYLLEQYLGNNCTEKELGEFWQLMFEFQENDFISEEFQQLWNLEDDTQNASLTVNWDALFEKLLQKKMKAAIATANNKKKGSNKNRLINLNITKHLKGWLRDVAVFYTTVIYGKLVRVNNKIV